MCSCCLTVYVMFTVVCSVCILHLCTSNYFVWGKTTRCYWVKGKLIESMLMKLYLPLLVFRLAPGSDPLLGPRSPGFDLIPGPHTYMRIMGLAYHWLCLIREKKRKLWIAFCIYNDLWNFKCHLIFFILL